MSNVAFLWQALGRGRILLCVLLLIQKDYQNQYNFVTNFSRKIFLKIIFMKKSKILFSSFCFFCFCFCHQNMETYTQKQDGCIFWSFDNIKHESYHFFQNSSLLESIWFDRFFTGHSRRSHFQYHRTEALATDRAC